MSDPFSITPTFLTAKSRLTPRDAVAAIIVNEENHCLLQLRDDKEDVFFSNHWGCFGGAIELGETPIETLLRELEEELGIDFKGAGATSFIQIAFNTTPNDTQRVERYFYSLHMDTKNMRNIRLGEGQAFRFFSFEQAMQLANITPYDKFALWLYYNQSRLPHAS